MNINYENKYIIVFPTIIAALLPSLVGRVYSQVLR